MKHKRSETKTLRIDRETADLVDQISEMSMMRVTDVMALMLKAAGDAIRPHVQDEIRFPLAFELAKFGNKLAMKNEAAKKGRKIKDKEMGPGGFEPTTKKIQLAPLTFATA